MAISVVIAAYNSAQYIERVIKTASVFDEVVVCDLGSSDNTVEIAASLGCRIISIKRKEGETVSTFRNRGIRSAGNEWVLMIRMNELIPPALKDYLYEFIKDPGDTKALYIPRKNFIMNRFDSTHYPDFQLRFFHKEHADWGMATLEEPSIDGKILKISSTRRELALLKIPQRFGSIIASAVAAFEEENPSAVPTRMTLFKIFFRPWSRFMNDYLFKGNFRHGVAGYINAMNNAIAEYYVMGRSHEDALMEDFYKELEKDGM